MAGVGPRPAAFLGMGVVVGAFSVWLIVGAAQPENYVVGRWISGIGGPILLIEAALSLVIGWRHLRPLTVRDGALRVVDGMRTHTIPFSEVSGVGLVFTWLSGRGGLPAGWYLTIWDGAGKHHRVVECWVNAHWASADYRTVTRPHQSSEDLARTDAGQMARRIYDAAWSVQGSGGPLATKQRQKMRDTTVWTREINTCAFWSPDGDMGEFAQSESRTDDWDD